MPTKRDLANAPGADPVALAQSFLPLVYGSAAALLPERPADIPRVVVAVFRSLRVRCPSPKRTVIPSWLVRTTWFIARQERRRLGLPPAGAAAAPPSQALLAVLNRLPPLLLDTLVLHGALQEPLSSVGRALRVKENAGGKAGRTRCGTAGEAARQNTPRTLAPGQHFSTLLLALPDEVQTFVESELKDQTVPAKKNALVRAALRSWRWMNFKRGLRRLAKAAAVFAGVLLVAAFTFVLLARQGYLTNFFIRLSFSPACQANARDRGSGSSLAPAATAPCSRDRGARQPDQCLDGKTLPDARAMEAPPTLARPSRLQHARAFLTGEMVLRNPKARRSGLARVLGLEFNWAEARLDFADRAFNKVAVRYRGNGTDINSLFGPKQSFKVDLAKFNKDQRLAEVRTLNLVSSPSR